MYIYTDYENQVIFIQASCCNSVEEEATILGQLRILGFIEISENLWKLEVPAHASAVFDFIVVQINTIMKPTTLYPEVMAFCEAVFQHKNSKKETVNTVKERIAMRNKNRLERLTRN